MQTLSATQQTNNKSANTNAFFQNCQQKLTIYADRIMRPQALKAAPAGGARPWS